MGQNSCEVFTIFLMRRRHRQRTVADDDGRDAVIAGVSTKRVPSHLSIVMRVVVDDTGSDHQTIRIDDPTRLTAHSSHLDDPPAAHGNVAVKARQAGTVNYLSVFNDQIVRHYSSYAANKGAYRNIVILLSKVFVGALAVNTS